MATTLPSYDEAERTKAEATIPLVPGRVSLIYCVYWVAALWELSYFHLFITFDLLLRMIEVQLVFLKKSSTFSFGTINSCP